MCECVSVCVYEEEEREEELVESALKGVGVPGLVRARQWSGGSA